MSDFSQRIAQERAKLNLTQEQLAQLTGVSTRTVSNYERGERSADAEFIAEMVKAGADPVFLLTGEHGSGASIQKIKSLDLDKNENVYVPKYNIQASAGPGCALISEAIVRWLPYDRDWVVGKMGLDPKHVGLVDVHGVSMCPTLNDGAMLLLDMRPQQRLRDGIYVVNFSGELLVKRLQLRMNGAVEIISDATPQNSEIVENDLIDQLIVIGRAVWQAGRI